MGSAMAARPTRLDEATTGDLAEVDEATAATKSTVTRRMQHRKAKHKIKTSGGAGGKAHGAGGRGVTLLNEPFTPKDSGMRLSASVRFSCLLAKLHSIAIDIGQPNNINWEK